MYLICSLDCAYGSYYYTVRKYFKTGVEGLFSRILYGWCGVWGKSCDLLACSYLVYRIIFGLTSHIIFNLAYYQCLPFITILQAILIGFTVSGLNKSCLENIVTL
ncbi:MAG: hypothetical protein UW64_C0010G0007 [Microgenomates group bacterium GW2011_GWC1_44_37]|nr:MAG: hypothetical protein UW64_C0010G0007 [Microgenomates group bacterium GW2011_GWC1_44_37]